MRITEYVNPLTWTPPGVTCDRPISSQIKEPLPNTASFLGFIGAPATGKTSLMMSMLTNPDMYHKAYHHVFFVCPASSRASIAGDPWKDHAPEKLFDELTAKVLEFVFEFAKVASHEKQYSLLILDDCASELKNKDIERLLKTLVWNRRHLKLTIWIMSQSYNALPLGIRKALSHCVMFRPRNKKELEAVFTELMFLPREQQVAITNHIFPEGEESKYGFMFLDTATGYVHKRFNRLELTE